MATATSALHTDWPLEMRRNVLEDRPPRTLLPNSSTERSLKAQQAQTSHERRTENGSSGDDRDTEPGLGRSNRLDMGASTVVEARA